MKKYFLILISTVFLLSCESEKDPCNIEYKLNEPSGFGRNEVTFLIDDETVWHSSQLVTSGGSSFGGVSSGSVSGLMIFQEKIKNENGTPIFDTLNKTYHYLDNYGLRLHTRNSNECNNYYYKNFHSEMFLFDFNENDTIVDKVNFSLVNYFINDNKPGYSVYKSDTFKANIFWNRKDSIIYGTFEGVLYNHSGNDSIKISNGVFDYRYKSINIDGEK